MVRICILYEIIQYCHMLSLQFQLSQCLRNSSLCYLWSNCWICCPMDIKTEFGLEFGWSDLVPNRISHCSHLIFFIPICSRTYPVLWLRPYIFRCDNHHWFDLLYCSPSKTHKRRKLRRTSQPRRWTFSLSTKKKSP